MFSLFCPCRCHITNGWTWRQTGRDWHTWKIKWGRLWPRTWPSDQSWTTLQTQLKSKLSQPNGTAGNAPAHPRSHPNEQHRRKTHFVRKWKETGGEKKKIHIYISYFHSGSLSNMWGFPSFHGDDGHESRTEINNEALDDWIFASAGDKSKQNQQGCL